MLLLYFTSENCFVLKLNRITNVYIHNIILCVQYYTRYYVRDTMLDTQYYIRYTILIY